MFFSGGLFAFGTDYEFDTLYMGTNLSNNLQELELELVYLEVFYLELFIKKRPEIRNSPQLTIF